MKYEDLVRTYSTQPLTDYFFRAKVPPIKLMLSTFEGNEQRSAGRNYLARPPRPNEWKVELVCCVFNDGKVGVFFDSWSGPRGSGYPTIPEKDLERLDQLLVNLPDDDSRLPPPDRGLVVQVPENDHYRVRVYDRADAPAEILDILRLSGSEFRPWLPSFEPSSEWVASEQADEIQICLSTDGQQIVTTVANGPLRFWNPDTGEKVKEVNFPSNISVSGLSFTPDGRFAVIQSWGQFYLLDTQTWRKYRNLDEPLSGRNREELVLVPLPSLVRSLLQITPDGRYLLINTSDSTLKIFDMKTWRRQPMLPDLPPDALSYVSAPKTMRAVYFSKNGILGLWNPEQRNIVAKLDDDARIHRVAFSPDESLVAIATMHIDSNGFWTRYRIRVWQAIDGRLLHELRPFEQTKCETLEGLLWSNDGKYLLAGTKAHNVYSGRGINVWSMKSGRHRGELNMGNSDIMGVLMLGDGRRIVAGCGDGRIRIWNVSDAIKQIEEFENSFSSH